MKIEAKNLRSKPIEELLIKLDELKSEFLSIRQQKNLGALKSGDISIARKNVARCLTVIREKRLAEAIETYKGEKRLPKDMRMKMTRKMRLKLTDNQKSKKVRSVRAREVKYRNKYFAYVEEAKN